MVRHEIGKRCISSLGMTYCEKIKFSPQFKEVMNWLMQTHEFMGILQSKRDFPLNYFFDLRAPLKTIAAPGSYISAENLFNLQRSLATIDDIIAFF